MTDFRTFCEIMKTYKFPIYVTRRRWIREGYFTRPSLTRGADFPQHLSPGNIALFGEGGPDHLGDLQYDKAVGFYYTEVGRMHAANITLKKAEIEFIRDCIKEIWELKTKHVSLDGEQVPVLIPVEAMSESALNLLLNADQLD